MYLYPHQIDCLKKTEEFNRCAYYLDMGLGKTFIGSEKMKSFGENVNLIICQKSKIKDWVNHIHENYNAGACDLTNPRNYDWFINVFLPDPNKLPCVAVINYELAWRRKELAKLHDFTLLLDESSLIQNTTAKQTKFIMGLHPKNVILLSGTPVSGKYENMYSQLFLLGYPRSEKYYLSRYVNFIEMDFGYGYPVKVINKNKPYKNFDELKETLNKHGAVFMKTEECFNLPEQNFITVNVPTTSQYKIFMRDGIVYMGGDEMKVGDTALTMRLYARELCGSYNQNKIEAYKTILQSTNDRLIVFYQFTRDLQVLLQATTDRSVSIINGFTKDLEAYENEPDSVTFVQYQAGSMGLNLQKANKIIYFTPTDRCEYWMQSQKRTHRIGQDKPCYYYMLTCENSIEEKIYDALKKGVDYTDKLFENDFPKVVRNRNNKPDCFKSDRVHGGRK